MTTQSAEELKNLGNQAFSAGNFAKAIEIFTQAIEIDPSNAILYSNRSACYASLQNAQLALEDAERACELNPEWSKAWVRKASALQILGRWEEAIKMWGKVAELDPRNDAAKRNMQLCLQSFVRNFQQHQKSAADATSEPVTTDTTESAEKEEKVEEENDNNKEAERLKELGTIEYKKKNFEQAMKYYEEAATLDPTNMTFILNQSAVLFEQSKFDECVQKCDEAIELGRTNHAGYALMAKAYARMGNAQECLGKTEEAIKALQKSLTENRTPEVQAKLKTLEKTWEEEQRKARQDPVLAEKEREQGNELFKAGKYAEAVQAYTEAIKRAEDDPRAYANRAACYLKLTAVSEGLKDCESALKLDPKFLKAYTRKAALLLLKKDYSECLEVCDRVLDMPDGGSVRAEMEGYKLKAMMAIQQATGGEGLQDPEVQAILGDPVMQQILGQMQQDPKAIIEHMRNPTIAAKMRKLISAGIIKMGHH